MIIGVLSFDGFSASRDDLFNTERSTLEDTNVLTTCTREANKYSLLNPAAFSGLIAIGNIPNS